MNTETIMNPLNSLFNKQNNNKSINKNIIKNKVKFINITMF